MQFYIPEPTDKTDKTPQRLKWGFVSFVMRFGEWEFTPDPLAVRGSLGAVSYAGRKLAGSGQ